MQQIDILNMLIDEDNQNQLDCMAQIHKYTKHYLLLAEELSENGESFLQPLKEHRDAYDHMMRIFSLHLRMNDLSDDFNFQLYVNENIKKAYGHEYRAFFDTADWLTFICRKKIRETLTYKAKQKQYIVKYGEQDFNELKVFINKLPYDIAMYRETKDISNTTLLQEVKSYKNTLDQLLEVYNKVQII